MRGLVNRRSVFGCYTIYWPRLRSGEQTPSTRSYSTWYSSNLMAHETLHRGEGRGSRCRRNTHTNRLPERSTETASFCRSHLFGTPSLLKECNIPNLKVPTFHIDRRDKNEVLEYSFSGVAWETPNLLERSLKLYAHVQSDPSNPW